MQGLVFPFLAAVWFLFLQRLMQSTATYARLGFLYHTVFYYQPRSARRTRKKTCSFAILVFFVV